MEKLTKKLKKSLEDQGYREIIEIPNKGICALFPFMFTVGLVTGIDEIGYEERFCYPLENYRYAILAIYNWSSTSPQKLDNPNDSYWIKRKSNFRSELTNPLYINL